MRVAATADSSVKTSPASRSSSSHHRRSRALDPHAHRHLWLNVKVLGADGKWSNVDSRVAMKLHTLINAEGDLAARTDPQWVAALARHGFTLDDDGEVAELAGVVRPFSRRSAQIEANRAKLVAEWTCRARRCEPQHPSPDADRPSRMGDVAPEQARPPRRAVLGGNRPRRACESRRPAHSRPCTGSARLDTDSTRWTWTFLRTPRSSMRTSGPPAPAAGSVRSISAPAPCAPSRAAE